MKSWKTWWLANEIMKNMGLDDLIHQFLHEKMLKTSSLVES